MKTFRLLSLLILTLLAFSSCNKTQDEEVQGSIKIENPSEVIDSITIQTSDGQTVEVQTDSSDASEPNTSEEPVSTIKAFNIIARNWSFSPSSITVNEGDTVRITITSVDKTHGFAISEFGVNESIEAGQTKTIEFVASKKGTFKFFCSVPCGDGHVTMTGILIVQ